MNVVDIIIVVFLIMGTLLGFSRGFLKQTVMFIGTILVVVFAFVLKNPLSIWMYKNLPFIKLDGVFEGLSSLNILIYEIIAFIIALSILSIALAILVRLTGIIEKVLKMTIILAIPSKILGAIVGFIQSVVVLYVILFILTLPILKIPYISDSKYSKIILNDTPFIKGIANNLVDTFNEISELTKDTVKINSDKEETNKNMVEIMLKNKVTTTDSIKILVDKDKLKIDGIDELLEKYKED